jgi:trigger factor
MKVTKEKEENRQVFLRVEMEPAEVEKHLEESYHQLVNRTDIPGFRKGKASREVLERHIGKEGLLEDALNRLLPQAYEQAIKEQGIEAFARPSIEIEQTDPVVFTATIPLEPIIKLGDYHQIRLTPNPVEVTEENINAVMEQLRRQHGTWEPAEREVAFDDLLSLDVESSDIGGKPFINQKGVQYQVLRDYPVPAPGFAEQLVGMKGGEEKEFILKLPEDYPQAEMAGKEAKFKVKVGEIKQLKLPPLNDEFAALVDSTLKTLDSLREKVLENLRLRAEEKGREEFEGRLVDTVAEQSQVEFPPLLADSEIARLIEQQARWMQATGGQTNKSEEELKEEMRPLATKRVTRSLVLEKVAEEEKIKVSDDEIHAEMEKLAPNIAGNEDELKKFLDSPEARSSVEQLVARRKAIELLAEIAKGSKKVRKTKE